MTNENKINHLKFIPNVITRINFKWLIKGQDITLILALFALVTKTEK